MDTTTTDTATLPTLTGSDKQIAWATTLRAASLVNLAAGRAATEQRKPVALPVFDAFVASIQAQTAASWWITNRDLANPRIYGMSAVFAPVSRQIRAL